MSGSSPEPIATDFASAEVESSPQVPTQSGDDKEAVLKLRPLRLLNDYHAIDVTSLAEDLFIIFTVDRTIQNWKLKVFLSSSSRPTRPSCSSSRAPGEARRRAQSSGST
mmetsp:Transcript_32100/g.76718  ORF Transcript_32100/g.76718 Transcript_32100/m.76718 type:complete len:109 (+) Transcript_32100:165-491(+)